MVDEIQKRLLAEIADLHEVPEGAYNIRANSGLAGRNTTANIDIVSKEDGSGIDIKIKPGTKKESVHIPVIGNGDIKTKEDALYMFQYTGVDGIMIGRASLGNPWIFKSIISYLKNEEMEEVSIEEKLNTIIQHIEVEIEEKGEDIGIKELRKHMSAYVKNLPDAASIRQKINFIETKNELISCLTEYFNNIKNII